MQRLSRSSRAVPTIATWSLVLATLTVAPVSHCHLVRASTQSLLLGAFSLMSGWLCSDMVARAGCDVAARHRLCKQATANQRLDVVAHTYRASWSLALERHVVVRNNTCPRKLDNRQARQDEFPSMSDGVRQVMARVGATRLLPQGRAEHRTIGRGPGRALLPSWQCQSLLNTSAVGS